MEGTVPDGVRRKRGFDWLKAHWCLVLFLVVCVFTLWMDVVTARTLIDGDASYHLYQALTIAKANNPFTSDFYYTTEVRLFDTTFFIAPFFKLFSNWTLIRLLGTMTLQAFYVASFLYLMVQAKVSKPTMWVAASLLLMPFSVAYARIVLYFLYYIVYLTYCFLLLGLLLRVEQLPLPVGQTSCLRKAILPMVLLALLWVIVGLNGVRHGMILLAPLLLQCFIMMLLQLKHTSDLKPWAIQNRPSQPNTTLRWFLLLLYSSFFYLIGFLINKTVLLPYYQVADLSKTTLMPTVAAQRYADILNGLMQAIGFRMSNAPMISARSVALACSIVSFGYLIWSSLRDGWKDQTIALPFSQRILSGFLLVTLALSTFVFLLNTAERAFELYYTPVVVMAYPLLAVQLEHLKSKALCMSRRILIWLTCLGFLFQGGYTGAYLTNIQHSSLDQWTGLGYREVTTTDDITDCIVFMHIYGYTYGMAPYWYANTMIEQSDGTLVIAPYRYVPDEDAKPENSDDGMVKEKIILYRWGTSKTAFQRENLPDQLIIFVPYPELKGFMYSFPDSKQVHSGVRLVGMEVDTNLIFPVTEENPS